MLNRLNQAGLPRGWHPEDVVALETIVDDFKAARQLEHEAKKRFHRLADKISEQGGNIADRLGAYGGHPQNRKAR